MGDRRGPPDQVRQLLKQVLVAPAVIRELSSAELDLALRAARRANVLGQVAARIEAEGLLDAVPDAAKDQLVSARILADARARLITWELNRVVSALTEDGPLGRLVVLKGCAYLLAELPNRLGRSSVDLDLLVPKDDLIAVEQRLLRFGWQHEKISPYDQNYYRAWTHELPPLSHPDRKVEVDLHHNIMPPTARLAPSAKRLWASAEAISGTRVERLADADLVLHAIVHLFFDSDLADRLRDLVDIDVLLRHFSKRDDGFCLKLVERAVELGLERPTYYALRYASRLVETPIPQDAAIAAKAGAPPKAVARLMDWLVEQAIFPQHPDGGAFAGSLARFCLYVRSHWIRMPPWLLARHLSYKLYVTAIRRSALGVKPPQAPSQAAPIPRPARERTRATPADPPPSAPSS